MTIFDHLQQSRYDEWGAEPPQCAWNSPARTAIEIAFLKRVLKPAPDHVLLDIFCSWGRHVLALAGDGVRVIGVDLSAPMLMYARQQAGNTGAAFIQADIQALPFVNSIDTAYSIQSSPFEAWNTPATALTMLASVRRALKPGGTYVFGWNHDSVLAANVEPYLRQRLTDAGITTYEGRSLPLHHYGYAEQAALITQAGFRITTAFNTYAQDVPYANTQPGLIVVAQT